jgi:hypothetical protein
MSQNTASIYFYVPGVDPFVDFVTQIANESGKHPLLT